MGQRWADAGTIDIRETLAYIANEPMEPRMATRISCSPIVDLPWSTDW